MALYQHWTEVTEITLSRAVCRCGWQGEMRESRALAMDDARQHKSETVSGHGETPITGETLRHGAVTDFTAGAPTMAGEVRSAEPAPGTPVAEIAAETKLHDPWAAEDGLCDCRECTTGWPVHPACGWRHDPARECASAFDAA